MNLLHLMKPGSCGLDLAMQFYKENSNNFIPLLI